jgi:dihydroorotate dehydrogenase
VQAYTGFVYGGPLWPRRVHSGLARHIRQAGLTSVAEAVGVAEGDDTAADGPDRPESRCPGT